MNESDAARREQLLQLQASLTELAATADGAAATVELDQARVGRLSRMDAMQAQAMSQATNRRREIAAARIRAALARLDNGEYGECVSCGELIAPARLDHDPSVPTCIDCASASET